MDPTLLLLRLTSRNAITRERTLSNLDWSTTLNPIGTIILAPKTAALRVFPTIN